MNEVKVMCKVCLHVQTHSHMNESKNLSYILKGTFRVNTLRDLR